MDIIIIFALVAVIVLAFKAYKKSADVEDLLYDISVQLHRHITESSRETLETILRDKSAEQTTPDNVTPEDLQPEIPDNSPGIVVDESVCQSEEVVDAPPVYQPVTFDSQLNQEQPDTAQDTTATERRTRSIELEKLIGENLMGKIGILALVVGIGFFVKLAIDNNWINEWSRTILGVVVGGVLWGIAYRIRDAYRNFSSVLAGGGFAVSFVSIAVAYNFYRLFPAPVTLGLLVALCGAMTWIALHYDRRELAVIAVLGGYVAPFMSSGPDGSLLMLLGYTALLTGVMSFVSYRRQWWILPAVGMIATWLIVQIALQSIILSSNEGVVLAIFSTIYFTLLSLPVATVMHRREESNLLFMVLLGEMVLNQIAFLVFGLSGMDANPSLQRLRGLIPIYLGLLNGVLFWNFYRFSESRTVAEILRWCAIIGVGLFIPIQFEAMTTVGSALAIYALFLTIVFIWSSIPIYFYASVIAILFDFIALLSALLFTRHGTGENIVSFVSGASYFAITYLVASHNRVFSQWSPRIINVFCGIVLNVGCALLTMAGSQFLTSIIPGTSYLILEFAWAAIIMAAVSLLWRPVIYTAGLMPLVGLFFLFVIEQKYPVTGISLIALWIGVVALGIAFSIFVKKAISRIDKNSLERWIIYFSVISASLIIEICVAFTYSLKFTNYYSAAVSVGLIIAGAAVMAAGLRYHRLIMRVISLSLFGILILKLLVYDLWLLPMVGRIIVLILLGVVMLTFSFLYQKLKSTIFSPDDSDDSDRFNH